MSNSNCNCNLQYSTPPWWVTMGFIPPANYPGQVQPPPYQSEPNPTTVLSMPTLVPPPPGRVSTIRPVGTTPGLNEAELAKLKAIQAQLAAMGSGHQPALPAAAGPPSGGLIGKFL